MQRKWVLLVGILVAIGAILATAAALRARSTPPQSETFFQYDTEGELIAIGTRPNHAFSEHARIQRYLWGAATIFVVAGTTIGFLRGGLARRTLRRRNALLNLRCPNCGFDIRGQFTAAREKCPECGCGLNLGRWVP